MIRIWNGSVGGGVGGGVGAGAGWGGIAGKAKVVDSKPEATMSSRRVICMAMSEINDGG
jgi:hypothetical protein